MAILIDSNSKVLVQGITGKEGARAAKEMLAYGTTVLAGVTPGKGGQDVEGKPVYNSVKEALAAHSEVNVSFIAVPNFAVMSAVLEAIAAKIPLINILTEHVPVRDTAELYEKAAQAGVRIVGPSSIGIISPGQAKIGSIGGDDPSQFSTGPVGVISKSGGMSAEISWLLTRAGIGQSTVIGIGGDIIIGSTYTDLMALFEKDQATRAIVIFGEFGGTYEEEAAELITQGKFTKPVVAFITGTFAETLPEGTNIGHAGAIVNKNKGTTSSKIEALLKAGAKIAKSPDEIPDLIKDLI